MDYTDIGCRVKELCVAAKAASRELAGSVAVERSRAIRQIASEVETSREDIFAANKRDIEKAEKESVPEAFLKRLRIGDCTFQTMIRRLHNCADMTDPLEGTIEAFTNGQGMKVRKVRTSLGVVAMIYESRPNVTTDCAAACLRSGNAVILRGGSEALQTNKVLVKAMRRGLEGLLPVNAIQLLDMAGHEAVDELLKMNSYIDLLVPRGGRSLIEAVEEKSRIPLMRHYDGICHQYLAADADIDTAVKVVVNSKCQRVEVCNSLETLLVDEECATRVLPSVAQALRESGVELRGCEKTQGIIYCIPATVEDWKTEYLDYILSIRIVEGVRQAADHIAQYGSGHTDGIVTQSEELANEFIRLVDSSSVLVNASTRLSGGEAYGMGAVIGISTGKLHARGPVGPEELTSYKWVSLGNCHLRG